MDVNLSDCRHIVLQPDTDWDPGPPDMNGSSLMIAPAFHRSLATAFSAAIDMPNVPPSES